MDIETTCDIYSPQQPIPYATLDGLLIHDSWRFCVFELSKLVLALKFKSVTFFGSFLNER